MLRQPGGMAADTAPRILSAEAALEICNNAAKEALNSRCGHCHQKSRSEKPRALRIYDLEEDEWYGHLSKKQMRGIKQRMGRSETATESEKEQVDSCMGHLLKS